jgi:hypothetical protein
MMERAAAGRSKQSAAPYILILRFTFCPAYCKIAGSAAVWNAGKDYLHTPDAVLSKLEDVFFNQRRAPTQAPRVLPKSH